jgi:hypothetical protein
LEELSSRVARPFCIPTAVHESSCCPTSSPHFIRALEFDYSSKCVVVLHCLNF